VQNRWIMLLGIIGLTGSGFMMSNANALEEVWSPSLQIELPTRLTEGDLFLRRADDMPWKRQLTSTNAAGRTTTQVEEDGTYYFTAKSGGLPSADEYPALKISVDSTRPIVELLSPLGGGKFDAGTQIRIDWIAADRHFSTAPISLEYSEDMGKTWLSITNEAPNNGHFFWKIPASVKTEIMIRVNATDLAGNRGADQTRSAIAIRKITAGDSQAETVSSAAADKTVGLPVVKANYASSQQHTDPSIAAITALLNASLRKKQDANEGSLTPIQPSIADSIQSQDPATKNDSAGNDSASPAMPSLNQPAPQQIPTDRAPMNSPANDQKPSNLNRPDIPVQSVTETGPILEPVAKREPNYGQADDGIPATSHPELDGNTTVADRKYTESMTHEKAAYISYIMAGNLVRQGRYKDALRYYRTAVDTDPKFDEAWSDLGLVYKQIGAYTKADACIVKALEIVPENHIYIHNRGEIHQALGLALLDKQTSESDLAKATDCIHFAVKLYGKAIEVAQKNGRLAECAPTFFRLGEVCYFGNQDPVGAREYWLKVLSLHSPSPELDDVMHSNQNDDENRAVLRMYRSYTEKRVQLDTWQRWAQAYLDQLDRLEQQVYPQPAPSSGGLPANQSRTIPSASFSQQSYSPAISESEASIGSAGSSAPYNQAGYGTQSTDERPVYYAPKTTSKKQDSSSSIFGNLFKKIFKGEEENTSSTNSTTNSGYNPYASSYDSSGNASVAGYMPYSQK